MSAAKPALKSCTEFYTINNLMRVYNLEDLPANLHDMVNLSPTSSYVLQNARVELKQLIPSPLAVCNSLEKDYRSSKKLEILKALRKRLLQNEYDLHRPNPTRRSKGRIDEKRTVSKNHQGVLVDRQQKKRKNKPSAKVSIYNAKPTNKEAELKVIKDRDVNYLGMTRQRSQKIICRKHSKKSVDADKIVSATRILYSKQLVREIDLEKQREEQRQAQLQEVEGLEARRLEKIHAIQRKKAQQKLDNLKRLQDTYLEAMTLRQSLCR